MENYEAIKDNVFEEYLMAWYVKGKKGKIQNLYIHRKRLEENVLKS